MRRFELIVRDGELEELAARAAAAGIPLGPQEGASISVEDPAGNSLTVAGAEA